MVPASVRPWEGEPTRRSPRAPGADQAGASTFLPKARSPQATLGPHVCWREDGELGVGTMTQKVEAGLWLQGGHPPSRWTSRNCHQLSPLLCTNHDHDTLPSAERERGDQPTARGTISGDRSLLLGAAGLASGARPPAALRASPRHSFCFT